MQAMRKEGQGSGGQDRLGDDGSGADDGSDGLGDHVGSWQGSGVAENHWSRDWADPVVSDDPGETTRGSGSDSQNGGEDSLWENSTCSMILSSSFYSDPTLVRPRLRSYRSRSLISSFLANRRRSCTRVSNSRDNVVGPMV